MKMSVKFNSSIKVPKISMPKLNFVSTPKIGYPRQIMPSVHKTKVNLTNKQGK